MAYALRSVVEYAALLPGEVDALADAPIQAYAVRRLLDVALYEGVVKLRHVPDYVQETELANNV